MMKAIIQIGSALAIFSIYGFVVYHFKKLGVHNLWQARQIKNGVVLLNIKHLFGIFIFGVISAIVFSFVIEIANPQFFRNYLYAIYTLFFGGLAVILANFSIKNTLLTLEGNKGFSKRQFFGYFMLRILFLFSYELFFRGVLLYVLLIYFNLWIAIGINTLLYFIIHLFDSKKELIGTIPFGILLCLLVYYNGNLMPAFIIHCAMSCTFEMTLFKSLLLKPKTS